jgi:putative flippase GtrA
VSARDLSSNAEVWRQFLRFLAIGGSAAASYVILCTLLLRAFPGHGSAISIAVHCSLIPVTFFFQRNVAFRSLGPIAKQFLGYFTVQLITIFVSTSLLARYLTDNSVLNALTFITISGTAAVLSFCIYKFIVFAT